MLHFYRSNRLEWLAEKLSDSLVSEKEAHPLQSDTVIVPNRNNARWLQFQLSAFNQISANIQYVLPAEWMWSEIRRIHPGTPVELASDKNPLKWAVMNVIMNNQIPENATLVRNYLNNFKDENRMERYLELSNLVASTFDKYLVHRPDMLLEWEKNKLISQNKHEVWQRDLWNRLNDQWKNLYENGLQYNRSALWKDLLVKIHNDELAVDSKNNLKVFHPGKLPEPLLELFVAYSTLLPVHIFSSQLVNFKNTTVTKNTFLSEMLVEENSSGEAFQFFLSEYKPDYGEQVHFANRRETGLLQVIQNRLISGEQAFTNDEYPDDTVSVHSCHSKLREVETLHHFILECLEQSNSLRTDEIAVVSPKIDEYTPYIKAVFDNQDGDLPPIPFSIGETHTNERNPISKAFENILEFIESRWFSSDFMEILHSGPVMDKFDFNDSNITTIRRWITDNHVTWGVDQEHRNEYKQPPNQKNTFRAALNRLWFASLYDLPDFTMIDSTTAFQGVDTTEMEELLARFSSFVNTLNQIRLQTNNDFSLSDWGKKALNWIDCLFSDDSEKYELNNLIEIIHAVIDQSSLSGFNKKIPFKIFKQEIVSLIAGSQSTTASLERGVIFSSMVPLRNFPFKIVAVIGLNEDQFPRKTVTPEFDLIQNMPLSRETNNKDEDRQLFLQYVMAPSEKLYISYIGRSAIDNEKIQTSVILEKWMDRIAELTDIRIDDLIKEEPLNGFSENLFKRNKSFSRMYADIAVLMGMEKKRTGNYIRESPQQNEARKIIRIRDLESFYRNPLKFYLREKFGVRISDYDDHLGEEKFVSDPLLSYKLTGSVLSWIEAQENPESIQNLLLNSGIVPEGFPGQKLSTTVIEQSRDILDTILRETGSKEKLKIDISNHLDNNYIEGFINSYSKEGYIDIFLSSKSGKNLIIAWIRYLTLLHHYDIHRIENRILFNAKKEGGEWLSFKPVERRNEVLANLIDVYLNGIETPFLFAPKTSYQFSKYVEKKGIEIAIQRAEAEWFGNYVIAENSDPFYQLWFGRSNPLELPEFCKNANIVFTDLINHLEE